MFALFSTLCHETMFQKSLGLQRIRRDHDQRTGLLKKKNVKLAEAKKLVEKKNREDQNAAIKEKKEDEMRRGVAEQEVLTTQAITELAVFVDVSKQKKKNLAQEKKLEATRKAVNEHIRQSQSTARQQQRVRELQQPRRLTTREKNAGADSMDVLVKMKKMEIADPRFQFNYWNG